MLRFIELTLFTSGKKVLVNLWNLFDIIPAVNGGCKITYWRSEADNYDLWVRETYEEIVNAIESTYNCDIANRQRQKNEE